MEKKKVTKVLFNHTDNFYYCIILPLWGGMGEGLNTNKMSYIASLKQLKGVTNDNFQRFLLKT